jgi:hypothetical protein
MASDDEIGPRDTTPRGTDTDTTPAAKTNVSVESNGAGGPPQPDRNDFVGNIERLDAAREAARKPPLPWTTDNFRENNRMAEAAERAQRAGVELTDDDADENWRRVSEWGAKQAAARRAPPSYRNGDGNAYAAATFKALADEVVATPDGKRNDTLNMRALRAFRVGDAAGIDRDEIIDIFTEAARAAGLPDGEIAATVRSARNGADKYGPADIPHPAADAHLYEVGGDQPGADDHVEGEDKPAPFYADRILTRSALRTLPDRAPLIDNVLDLGTTALLYGKWGTAKSFIGVDWALSVATGRKWQGRAVHQCRALYVAGEGAFGFRGRIDAWETGWHTEISDTDFALLPFPVNLTRPLEVANLAALIDWGGYSFVILDTLARCMVGADENSAKDCGIVVDSMTRLLASTPDGRGVVLGAHHAGKDGKTMRGSSAFEGAADTVYFSRRDGAVIVLDREKRKDGPEADRHELKIDPIPGTGSAVISVHRGGGQTDRGERLLSTFVHHFAATGASKAELRLVADMPPATFHRALSDLVTRGVLVNTGTDKRPFYVSASE